MSTARSRSYHNNAYQFVFSALHYAQENLGRDADSGHVSGRELLEGVRSFLREDVAASEDGRAAFLARVAANSLGIAQREMLMGPGLARDEEQRLRALLGDGELETLRWDLVSGLRGQLALDTAGLTDHLRQTVAGQLAIDQPFYSALASN